MKETFCILIIICSITTIGVAQNSTPTPMPPADSKSQSLSDSELKEHFKKISENQAIFGKKSSTKLESDDGFKIVAIRKVFILLNDIDSEGSEIKVRKNLIEFEFYARVLPISSAVPDFIIIGDKIFPPSKSDGCADNKNCLMLRMTIKEFDSLIDNSFVTLTKGFRVSSETLKTQYLNGEPKEIVGAKFGRLNKAMINQSQIIERGKSQ